MPGKMLEAVKLAIPIRSNAYDDDLLGLIEMAKADLKMVGVELPETDPFMKRTIITYCKANFGSSEDYDRLKAAYDEQKGQLMGAHSYKPEVTPHE